MDDPTPEIHQTILLKMFAGSKGPRLSAADFAKKIAAQARRTPAAALDPAAADHGLAGLIEAGLIAVAGGGKTALHPRPQASYRLTEKGKDRAKHLSRPPRPSHHEDSQLQAQESYILLQLFRSKDGPLSRSKLNDKLKSKAAIGSLEFKIKEEPETIDYHLSLLVEKGYVEEKRQGVGVSYALGDEGRKALATATQHEGATFNLTGGLLNELLKLARESNPAAEVVDPPKPSDGPAPAPEHRSIGVQDILELIDQLKSGDYAGRDLIPIHELRALVAERHGKEAASHPTFDPLLKRIRGDDQLDLIAISDNRDATQEQLDDSIPGMNETIFYIVVG